MITETVELTLSHVGLGRLTERSTLTLFASAQAHLLTAGTGNTLHQVTDAAGAALYPSYLWLHLQVPPASRLERFGVWDRVDVSVEAKRYGGIILESSYRLGAVGELAAQGGEAIAMRAASIWTIDGSRGEPAPARPREGAVAALPALPHAPDAVENARRVRNRGRVPQPGGQLPPGTVAAPAPVRYPIELGRDVAPGHNLMFATYVDAMDAAEAALLRGQVWPPLPAALLQHRSLLEREIYFLQHTGPGHCILTDVRARLQRCDSELHGADQRVVSAGVLEVELEQYEEASRELLVVARARKLLVVPRSGAALLAAVARALPAEAG
jgi:probable biosynthetic protein (TIGR04098 family)